MARRPIHLEPAERDPAKLKKTGLSIAVLMMIGGVLVTFAYRLKHQADEQDARPHVVQRLTEVFFGRDQNKKAFSTEQLKGKTTLFTPLSLREGERMREALSAMRDLSRRFPDDESLRFLGITVDPEADGPDELQRLLAELGVADDKRWYFVQAEEEAARGYIRHKIRAEFKESVSSLEGPRARFRSTLVFIDENLHVLAPMFDLNLAREVAADAERLLEENPEEARRLKAQERVDDVEKARARLNAVLRYIREGDLKEG
ncbi:MAG TPA: hypothetical protein DD438_11925 [Verrucomicrobiales bacterium]|nr:hypothetical protein [Verrucomicrobiales bacterium]HCQ39165.1 hypothetical protein [Verrucomicrobiales bacterium]